MPRPPVKKTRKLAEAAAFGEAMGRLKALKKMKLPDKIQSYVDDILKNTTVQSAADIAIYAGLAYLSWQTFGHKVVTKIRNVPYEVEKTGTYHTGFNAFVEDLLTSGVPSEVVFKDPKLIIQNHTVKVTRYTAVPYEEAVDSYLAALYGPVALKLAMSENIVAGASGIVMLAALGIATLDVGVISGDLGKRLLDWASVVSPLVGIVRGVT